MQAFAVLPLPRRILAAIVSPGELFATFTERTPWFDALLISIAGATAAFLFLPHELFVEAAHAAFASSSPQSALPDGTDSVVRNARVWMIVGSSVGLVGMSLGLAGILTLIFSRILDGTGRFGQYLAVTAHAGLILALGMLLTAPVQAIRGDLSIQLSLALLAPFLEDGVLYAFLQSLNVFNLWMLVVLALGVSIVDRRRSWFGAGSVLMGLYLAFALTGAFLRG